ncbi:MAG TPA: hypothetical protein G4O00_05175 [Thermoflexia bacterium]|jgi:hypothetical protein|nr:hypothetical protein [Thermoflexia bacterium]
MAVKVLLSGRLYVRGYGQDKKNGLPGWFELDLQGGETVQEVIEAMGVPSDEVSITMVNGKECKREASVRDGDRVILIPPDVAALWRYLSAMSMHFGSVFDL